MPEHTPTCQCANEARGPWEGSGGESNEWLLSASLPGTGLSPMTDAEMVSIMSMVSLDQKVAATRRPAGFSAVRAGCCGRPGVSIGGH